MKNVLRLVLVNLLVVALLLGALSVLADAGGEGKSVVGQQLLTAAAGTRSYTTTATIVVGSVAEYGAAQIQMTVDVTGTQSITLTPQFSNYSASCTASSLQWFDAKDWVYSTSTLDGVINVTETATVTLTSSAALATFNPTLSVTGGDGTAGREFDVQGRCLRLSLATSDTGEVFTPTIYVRALDRN